MKSDHRTARRYSLIAGAFLACGMLAAEALAAETGPVTIKRIRTGWAADTFAIETDEAILNPAGCSMPDGYISDSSHPGYKTYYAVVLMAFSSGKPVSVIISNTECYSGRSKIMGVYVAK
jgi:hypothetical protein